MPNPKGPPPAIDKHQSTQAALGDCYPNALPVTPADGQDLPFVTRALYVGGLGDLSVVMQGGQTLVIPNVQPGVLRLRVRCVNATGTHATGIVALW